MPVYGRKMKKRCHRRICENDIEHKATNVPRLDKNERDVVNSISREIVISSSPPRRPNVAVAGAYLPVFHVQDRT